MAETTFGQVADSAIGGLFGLANTAIAGRGNRRSQKRAYKYNERAAENAYQRQLDFWNRVNDYNLPSNAYSRELAGLRENGLSVGQFYSNGTSPGAVAGNVSAPEGSGASGGMSLPSPDITGPLGDIASFQALRSQIDLNDSNTRRNNAEADFYSSRQDVATSQVELNYALAGDARARSISTELDAQLKEDLLPLTVEQARQTVSLNEQLLVDYIERAKRSVLETRFSEDTYSDRRSIVTADLQDKVVGIVLQRVQARALEAQIPLTEAQISNVRSQTQLNFRESKVAGAREHNINASTGQLNRLNRILDKDINWYDRKEVLKVVDQFADYWFKILSITADSAKGSR